MSDVPDSETPEQAVINAEVILMWEDYFREDGAIPEWLGMAQLEFDKLAQYGDHMVAGRLQLAAPLAARVRANVAALRARIEVVEAEFSLGRLWINGEVWPVSRPSSVQRDA